MEFPARIDWKAFVMFDGRETTEAQVCTAAAWDFILTARHSSDDEKLRKTAFVVLLRTIGRGFKRPDICPLLAILEVSLERRVLRLRTRLFFRAILAYIRARWAPPAWAPGWNDYHMVRWYMTGAEGELLEVFQRAAGVAHVGAGHIEDDAVFLTALRMVRSVRLQDPEFDAAITEVENRTFPLSSISLLTAELYLAGGSRPPRGTWEAFVMFDGRQTIEALLAERVASPSQESPPAA